jgi:hypothetical protein
MHAALAGGVRSGSRAAQRLARRTLPASLSTDRHLSFPRNLPGEENKTIVTEDGTVETNYDEGASCALLHAP